MRSQTRLSTSLDRAGQAVHPNRSGSERNGVMRSRTRLFRVRCHLPRIVSLSLALVAPLLLASPLIAQPAQGAFGFQGAVSGFPTGAVFVSGGGAYDLATSFVHSAGGFRCTSDVEQGPLSMPLHGGGPCLAGQGVRWDTAGLLTSTKFKCTGAAGEAAKTAFTSDTTAVLQADFYRAGDGNDESFTAQMIVSEVDIAPGDFPGVNLWVQGVGCGSAIVNFR